jgi:hypothetical protein
MRDSGARIPGLISRIRISLVRRVVGRGPERVVQLGWTFVAILRTLGSAGLVG